MAITKKDVEYIAQLARIHFTEEEKEKFTGQLDAIVKYIEQLKELDTSNVSPTTHALPIKNVMREDEVTNLAPNPIIFKNAPEQDDNLFMVPKVIE